MLLSGCSFKWPEWATRNEDPLAFLGSGPAKEDPPLPDHIPKTEPDQHDPEFARIPASTMDVNLETYFIQDIKDPITRVQRLENVLVAMQKDMQTNLNLSPMQKQMAASVDPVSAAPLLPVISNKMAPSNNIPIANKNLPFPAPPAQQQSYQARREILSENIPSSYYQGVMAPPDNGQGNYIENARPRKTYQVSFDGTAPTSERRLADQYYTNTKAVITGFRIGEHPDKVRIVLDTTAKTPFKADLDNAEQLLILEMPQAQWQAPFSNQSFGRRQLVDSMTTESMGQGGTRAVLQLSNNTTIISQKMFPDLSGSGGRIVIDLRR